MSTYFNVFEFYHEKTFEKYEIIYGFDNSQLYKKTIETMKLASRGKTSVFEHFRNWHQEVQLGGVISDQPKFTTKS